MYIEELGGLVDNVPAVPFAKIESAVREDFGEKAFVSLDPEPLATASIAQTHRGLLATGEDVVVKVRRPGVVEQVDLDLAVLRSTVRIASRHSESAQRVQLEELADELEIHLRAELDFVEEAHNAELVRKLVEPYDGLVVPRMIRPYVTERTLVMERISGVKVVSGHGVEPERAALLAREFFRAYVFQVVVEGVYHADSHQGNVLLTDDGRLALLDFGLLGRLDEDTRTGLALLLLALAQNRADDVADLIVSLSLTSAAPTGPASRRTSGASCPASTTGRLQRSNPATPSPICSGPRSGGTSGSPRPSRSSGRRSRRPTRSPDSSTRSSTPSP